MDGLRKFDELKKRQADLSKWKPPADDVETILDRLESPLGEQESGNRQDAVNPRTGASGRFQVMPENIGPWTEKHLGRRMGRKEFMADPAAQIKVFRGEFGSYLRTTLPKAGGDTDKAIRMAAAGWYGGPDAFDRYDDPVRFRANEPSFREYTSSVLDRYGKAQPPKPIVAPDFEATNKGFADRLAALKGETPTEIPAETGKFDKQGNWVTRTGGELPATETPAPEPTGNFSLNAFQQAQERMAAYKNSRNGQYQEYLKALGDGTTPAPDTEDTRAAFNQGMQEQSAYFQQEQRKYAPPPQPVQPTQPQQVRPTAGKRQQPATAGEPSPRNRSVVALPFSAKGNRTFKQYFEDETARRLLELVPGATETDVREALGQVPMQLGANGTMLNAETERELQRRFESGEQNQINLNINPETFDAVRAAVAKNRIKKQVQIASDISGGKDLKTLDWNALAREGIYIQDYINEMFSPSNDLTKEAGRIRQQTGTAWANVLDGTGDYRDYLDELKKQDVINAGGYQRLVQEYNEGKDKVRTILAEEGMFDAERTGRSEFPTWRALTPDEAETRLPAKLQEIFATDGTIANWLKRREKEEADRAEGWRRVASSPGAFVTEASTNIARAFPQAASAILRSIGIGAESIEAFVQKYGDEFGGIIPAKDWLLTGDNIGKAAPEKATWQAADWIDEQVERWLPQDPILRQNMLATELPNVLGQTLTQIAAGYLTGGSSLPLAMGFTQGAEQQYKDAMRSGATQNQRLAAAFIGGLAAVPDAILFNKWFGGMNPSARVGFIRRTLNSISERIEQFGLPKEWANTIGKRFFKNAVEGGAFEGIQEVSENKINDAYASLTYDPKRRVFVVNDEDVASFLGGLLGGVAGGGVETAIETGQGETRPAQMTMPEIREGLQREAEQKAQTAEMMARYFGDTQRSKADTMPSLTDLKAQLPKSEIGFNRNVRESAVPELPNVPVRQSEASPLTPTGIEQTAPETALVAETAVEDVRKLKVVDDKGEFKTQQVATVPKPVEQVAEPVRETPEADRAKLDAEAQAGLDVPVVETEKPAKSEKTKQVELDVPVTETPVESLSQSDATNVETPLDAQEAKEPWQMTRDEFDKYIEFSGKDSYDAEVMSAITGINDHPLMPKETIRDRQADFYTFTNKKGKTYDFDLVVAYADNGRKRYLGVYKGDDATQGANIAAGIVFDKDSNLVGAKSSTGSIGLTTALMNAAWKDLGGFTVKGPASRQGANVARKFLVTQAVTQGKPVPAEVLADYPDLAEKYAKKTSSVQSEWKVGDRVSDPTGLYTGVVEEVSAPQTGKRKGKQDVKVKYDNNGKTEWWGAEELTAEGALKSVVGDIDVGRPSEYNAYQLGNNPSQTDIEWGYLKGRGRAVADEIAWLKSSNRTSEAEQLQKAFSVPVTIDSEFNERSVTPDDFGHLWFHGGSWDGRTTVRPGIWFARNKEGAGINFDEGRHENVHSAYIAAKRIWDAGDRFFDVSTQFANDLRQKGYDAIVGDNLANGPTLYILNPDIVIPSASFDQNAQDNAGPLLSRITNESIQNADDTATEKADANVERSGAVSPRNSREEEAQSPLKSVSSVEDWDSEAYDRELDSITLKRNAEGKILAPNGKVSKIQNERLAKVIRSKAFKEWFGDWINDPENASKVVDHITKEPLVVYHGTAAKDIESFNPNRAGEIQYADWGKGTYFATSPFDAGYYASDANAKSDDRYNDAYNTYERTQSDKDLKAFQDIGSMIRRTTSGAIYPAFLNLRHPFGQGYTQTPNPTIGDYARRSGYDGIIVLSEDKAFEELIVFEPNQIKSIFNRGSFSVENDSILKSVSAPVSDLGFYSAVEQTILDKVPNKASVEQVRGILNPQKSPVKQEELDWLGLDEFLRGKQTVTKQELLDFVRANNVEIKEVVKGDADTQQSQSMIYEYDRETSEYEGANGISVAFGQNIAGEARDAGALFIPDERDEIIAWDTGGNERFFSNQNDAIRWLQEQMSGVVPATAPKFEQYQLEGDKENYRELLLTLPHKPYVFGDKMFAKYGENWRSRMNDAERAEYNILSNDTAETFHSEHFDEPNILAHVRFNERTDADGKKVLFVEEIQSDWHQAGRKQGYSNGNRDALQKELEDVISERARAHSADDYHQLHEREMELTQQLNNSVPDAPFKKSWHELAMKRVLRYAAENGFDKVAWTPGAIQIDRYNEALRQNVDRIDWKRNGENVTITAFKDGERKLNESIPLEGTTTIVDKTVDLDDVVGKHLAEQIRESSEKSGSFSGEGLSIGGEGMIGFYDRILPAFVNKYTKKWGGRVDTSQIPIELPGIYKSAYFVEVDGQSVTGQLFEGEARHRLAEMRAAGRNAVLKAVQNTRPGASVHSVDITPSMRESVMAGQPLFAKRDSTRTELLNDLLPYEKDLRKVTDKVESSFNNNGELEVNEHAAEVMRRVMAQLNKDDNLPFDGVTMPKAYVRKLANRIRAAIPAMQAAGWDTAPITQLVDNLDKLAQSKEHGIAYVFDDALPEERVHAEDLTLGRTDDKAAKTMKSSPLWKAAQTGRFDREYGAQSEANRISELAAKLATGQASKYGFDRIDNFEAEKEKFLQTWADGVLRGNEATIEDIGAEAFIAQYPTVGKYGQLENKTGNAAGVGSPGIARGTDESGETQGTAKGHAEESDGPSRPETAQTESEADRRLSADGQLKKRKTVQSLENRGYIDEGVLGDAAYYQEISRDEAKQAARERIAAIGLQQAIGEAKLPAEDPSSVDQAFKMEVAETLLVQAEEARQNGDKETAAVKLATAFEVIGTLATQSTSYGQAISQLAAWSRINPETAVQYVTYQRAKNKLEPLTESQIVQLRKDADDAAGLRQALDKAIEEASVARHAADMAQAALADAEKTAGAAVKDARTFKRLYTLWKNKATNAGATTAAARVRLRNRTERDIYADLKPKEQGIIDALRAKFGGPLKSTSLTSTAMRPLKSVASPSISDDDLNALSEIAELRILENTPYEKVIAELADLTNNEIDMMALRDAHSRAVESIENARQEAREKKAGEIANDPALTAARAKIKEAANVRREHAKRAKEYRFETGQATNKFERELMARGASEPDYVVTAAMMLGQKKGLTPSQIARELRDAYPAEIKDGAAAIDAATAGARLRRDVRRELKAERDAAKGVDQAESRARQRYNNADAKLRRRVEALEKRSPGVASRVIGVAKSAMVSAFSTSWINLVGGRTAKALNTTSDVFDLALQKLLKVGNLNSDSLDVINAHVQFREVLGFDRDEALSGIAKDLATNWIKEAKAAAFLAGTHQFSDRTIQNSRTQQLLNEFPEFTDELFKVYNSDIEAHRKVVAKAWKEQSAGEKARTVALTPLDLAEKFVDKANFINRFQEFLMRNMEFDRALNLRLANRGLSLTKIIENKDWGQITNDDLAFAVNSALRVTFALRPKGNTIPGQAVRALTSNEVGRFIGYFTAPFSNFIWNAQRFTTPFAPGLGPVLKVYREKRENPAVDTWSDAVRRLNSRDAAQQIVGMTLLGGLVMALRALGSDDDDWKKIKMPYLTDARGKPQYLDVGNWWPITPFFWMANKVNRVLNGKPVFSSDEPYKVALEISEALLSVNERTLDNPSFQIIKDIFEGDYEGRDRAIWKFLGGQVGAFTRPFKTLKDLADTVDGIFDITQGAEKKDVDLLDFPFEDAATKNVPFRNTIWQKAGAKPAKTVTEQDAETERVMAGDTDLTGALRLFGYTFTSKYHRPEVTAAEKKAASYRDTPDYDGNPSPQTKRERRWKAELYAMIGEAGQDPQKVALVNQIIDKVVRRNMLTEGQAGYIRSSVGLTRFQQTINRVGTGERDGKRPLAEVLKLATDDELREANELAIMKLNRKPKVRTAESFAELVKKEIERRLDAKKK